MSGRIVNPPDCRNGASACRIPPRARPDLRARTAPRKRAWSATMHRLAGLFAAFMILCGSSYSPVLAKDNSLTVFAAASMNYATRKKTIQESTRVSLLGNSIVLIAPKDSTIDHVAIGQGFDLAKLAGDGRIATADVKSVPVGKYAKASLENLGAWSAAETKFAMTET